MKNPVFTYLSLNRFGEVFKYTNDHSNNIEIKDDNGVSLINTIINKFIQIEREDWSYEKRHIYRISDLLWSLDFLIDRGVKYDKYEIERNPHIPVSIKNHFPEYKENHKPVIKRILVQYYDYDADRLHNKTAFGWDDPNGYIREREEFYEE